VRLGSAYLAYLTNIVLKNKNAVEGFLGSGPRSFGTAFVIVVCFKALLTSFLSKVT